MAKAWMTSAAVTSTRTVASTGTTSSLSTASRRGYSFLSSLPAPARSSSLSRKEEKDSGAAASSPSWYSYSQLHWTPVALMVSAGSSVGVYCAVSNWKDGTEMNRSTITGPTVQITSIRVLWLVRDGVGLAPARYLTMHQARSTMTSRVIGTMNHSV